MSHPASSDAMSLAASHTASLAASPPVPRTASHPPSQSASRRKSQATARDAERSDTKTSDTKIPDATTSNTKTFDAKTPNTKTLDIKTPDTAPVNQRVTKQERVLTLLNRPEGATIAEMMNATGWRAHSVRGFLAGTVKKTLGFTLNSTKAEDGIRRYRIAPHREHGDTSNP